MGRPHGAGAARAPRDGTEQGRLRGRPGRGRLPVRGRRTGAAGTAPHPAPLRSARPVEAGGREGGQEGGREGGREAGQGEGGPRGGAGSGERPPPPPSAPLRAPLRARRRCRCRWRWRWPCRRVPAHPPPGTARHGAARSGPPPRPHGRAGVGLVPARGADRAHQRHPSAEPPR